MKYRNTGNGIISTFVKPSFLSMSVMRQIWKARRQFIVTYRQVSFAGHRSQVTGHCFTNTESIQNTFKS